MMQRLLAPCSTVLAAVLYFNAMTAVIDARQKSSALVLNVFVHDTEKRPIRNVALASIDFAGTLVTDDAGRAQLQLPAKFDYGQKVRLQIVGRDFDRWDFVSPFSGEVTVPKGSADIVLRPKGGRGNGASKDADIVLQYMAQQFKTQTSAIVGALRPGDTSITNEELQAALDSFFRQRVEPMAAQLLAEMRSRLSEPGLDEQQRAYIRKLESDLAQSQRATSEAERRSEYLASRLQYEAYVQRVSTATPAGSNFTPASTANSAPGPSSGSAAKSLLALGGVVGGIIGVAELVKKFSPHADATFTTDCLAPCALIRSATVARFQVTTPDTANFEYRWDFGDRNTDFGPSVTHVFFEDGTYTVTVTATPVRSDSTATGATASGTVTVKSLAGLWRFASGNSQGSLQLSQGSSSVFGQYTIGSTSGNVSGTLTNPRAVRVSIGFNGDSLDGTADAAVNVVNGNYRVAGSGSIQPFTLTRVQ